MKTQKKYGYYCSSWKGRGFVYPGSEIYGGLANSWDYGPLGVELKKTILKGRGLKSSFRNVPITWGLTARYFMNPETWVASGSLRRLFRPAYGLQELQTRHRADKLIEDYVAENGLNDNPAAMSDEEMMQYIKDKGIARPNCGSHDFTDIRKFNLMFKTFQGVTRGQHITLYLRPETAQGIFVNFKNIARTTRKKYRSAWRR